MASEVRRPPASWSQQTSEIDEAKNRINITIILPEIVQSSISFEATNTTISFEAKAGSSPNNVRYRFNCHLYAEVKSEDLRTSLSPDVFSVVIPKAKKGVRWPHLMDRQKSTIPDHLGKTTSLNCTDGPGSLKAEYRRLEMAEIEQVIENLERGVRINQDGDSVRREDLYSVVTRDKSHATVPRMGGGISEFESSGQWVAGGNDDDPRVLHNHAVDCLKYFSLHEDIKDLEQAIRHFERSAQLTPDSHPDKPFRLRNLGLVLVTRFQRLGEIADIDHAISNHEQTVQLTPDGHRDKPSYFYNLGVSFLNRFERLGEMVDIEQALLNLRRAVDMTPDYHPSKPDYLANLGTSYLARFGKLGELVDIELAILNHKHAVQLTPDDCKDEPSRLRQLGTTFLQRFKRLGEMADIEQAVTNHERAVQFTPDGTPDKPNCLCNLGNSLLTRFSQLGELADIEQAILNHRRAVQLTPDGNFDKPDCLNNLGCSFRMRFKQLGEMVDIEQSIMNHEHAVQLAPDDHTSKARFLCNLGHAFHMRFDRLGEIADIEQAIFNNERAIQLTPDGHPSKPDYLANVGISYWKRFDRLKQEVDIDRAILSHARAVQLMPDGHTDKPMFISNLGNSYLRRFEFLGKMADIDEAIVNQERAVQLTPDGHWLKPHQFNNLGNSLSARFMKIRRYEDLLNGIAAYRTSAHLPYGPPAARLYAAKKWSWLARCELGRHPSDQPVLDAYKIAFDLLPRTAWVGLSIDSRHHEIIAASSLACNAAATAISENDPQLALTWLEQGRSIVWGQILQLRTPVDELCRVHPGLGEELNRVSAQLERGTSGDHFAMDQITESQEAAVQKHRQLAQVWDRIVEQVRKKPGFERFLLPKQYSELRHAARDGPVIVLNTSEYACDALIIISERLHHVHLESFSYKKAQNLRESLHSILSHQGLRVRYNDRGAGPVIQGNFRGDDAFRPILAELWNSVVKPVLECLQSHQISSPTEDEGLRIRWCPTGPLAFLPIHAAGLYNADGTSLISLPDIAISSYTPTLTAVLRNSQHVMPHRSRLKLLAVIQPTTPGVAPLPGTREELKIIRTHCVSDSSVHVLEGSKATIAEVTSGMEECSWVHLACHGVQDTSHPMESGLLVHDGRIHLSKIIQKNLRRAEFAFLSACQTATGDVSRPEEAIHLAAGMLLAGYRGVVATMWSIRDDDAPFVADKFYGRLLKNGEPTSTKPAEALHFAIRELREKPGGCKFSSWVPFIHMGV
ncbi:hypothetical protein BD410DRAFT_290895 [Rickenella mellea]|uniref:CS domain-containing protein n=1 Tax=Rickenella mellea TaxID=50990 RepID=A0A4Y7Q2U2_9AGAM|nr:hypothetical protein BD410DRAFT_290895 [Rickenella mellea]